MSNFAGSFIGGAPPPTFTALVRVAVRLFCDNQRRLRPGDNLVHLFPDQANVPAWRDILGPADRIEAELVECRWFADGYGGAEDDGLSGG